MRRLVIVFMVCLLLVWTLPALAEQRVIQKDNNGNDVIITVDPEPNVNIHVDLVRDKHDPRKFALDWYKNHGIYGMGLKFKVYSDYFSTVNCEYDALSNDVLLSLGAMYRIPKEVLIWHFYFGGEYTFSRTNLMGTPYVTVGTDFLVFFSEVKYPLTLEEKPVYRSGFRFYF